MNYTIPSIVTSDDLKKRSYITFYYNNERVREYNGKPINILISPNRASSVAIRADLLEKLRYEYHKALEAGKYSKDKTPQATSPTIPDSFNFQCSEQSTLLNRETISTRLLLKEALDSKLSSDLSRTYKRDLVKIHQQFSDYLTEAELISPITNLTTSSVQKFLSQFGSSGTYYMNKRRNLGVLINTAAAIEDKQLKVVKATSRRKPKAKLHEKYEQEQLKPILKFLKEHYFKLYICCLLTYSSWLRPHEEIRLLTVKDFKKDLCEIHLTGAENKGGQVRVVYVPDYVREELARVLLNLKRDDNIFSRCKTPFNESYFNTQWSRAYEKMHNEGLIFENQTIYSFRHTAAVQLYRRTKDVYLLQKLLGHSSIVVTLKYLRSLGELNSDELKEAAPTL